MEKKSLAAVPHTAGQSFQNREVGLPLVTIRALFGIEFFGWHPEHIVALDADPVQDG
jgi:hypothetical protein